MNREQSNRAVDLPVLTVEGLPFISHSIDQFYDLGRTIHRLAVYPFVYRGIDPSGRRIEEAIEADDFATIEAIVRAHRTLFYEFPSTSDTFPGQTNLIYRAIRAGREGIAEYFYFQLRDYPEIYDDEWRMLSTAMIRLGRWDWFDRINENVVPVGASGVLWQVVDQNSTDDEYQQQLIEYKKRFAMLSPEELTTQLTFAFSARSCGRLVDLGAIPSEGSVLYPRYRKRRANKNWTTTIRLLRFIVFAQRRWRQLRQLADPVPFRLEM